MSQTDRDLAYEMTGIEGYEMKYKIDWLEKKKDFTDFT